MWDTNDTHDPDTVWTALPCPHPRSKDKAAGWHLEMLPAVRSIPAPSSAFRPWIKFMQSPEENTGMESDDENMRQDSPNLSSVPKTLSGRLPPGLCCVLTTQSGAGHMVTYHLWGTVRQASLMQQRSRNQSRRPHDYAPHVVTDSRGGISSHHKVIESSP